MIAVESSSSVVVSSPELNISSVTKGVSPLVDDSFLTGGPALTSTSNPQSASNAAARTRPTSAFRSPSGMVPDTVPLRTVSPRERSNNGAQPNLVKTATLPPPTFDAARSAEPTVFKSDDVLDDDGNLVTQPERKKQHKGLRCVKCFELLCKDDQFEFSSSLLWIDSSARRLPDPGVILQAGKVYCRNMHVVGFAQHCTKANFADTVFVVKVEKTTFKLNYLENPAFAGSQKIQNRPRLVGKIADRSTHA